MIHRMLIGIIDLILLFFVSSTPPLPHTRSVDLILFLHIPPMWMLLSAMSVKLKNLVKIPISSFSKWDRIAKNRRCTRTSRMGINKNCLGPEPSCVSPWHWAFIQNRKDSSSTSTKREINALNYLLPVHVVYRYKQIHKVHIAIQRSAQRRPKARRRGAGTTRRKERNAEHVLALWQNMFQGQSHRAQQQHSGCIMLLRFGSSLLLYIRIHGLVYSSAVCTWRASEWARARAHRAHTTAAHAQFQWGCPISLCTALAGVILLRAWNINHCNPCH